MGDLTRSYYKEWGWVPILLCRILLSSLTEHLRNEMLTKVRQFREEMARLQNRLRHVTDLTASGNKTGANDIPDGGHVGMSEEEKLRQQVMLGTESLERTSQSIAR